jgi:hypothetical protein
MSVFSISLPLVAIGFADRGIAVAGVPAPVAFRKSTEVLHLMSTLFRQCPMPFMGVTKRRFVSC